MDCIESIPNWSTNLNTHKDLERQIAHVAVLVVPVLLLCEITECQKQNAETLRAISLNNLFLNQRLRHVLMCMLSTNDMVESTFSTDVS